MKKMSHDADSLNTFSAMLVHLAENYYKGGFVQGLPVKDLLRALMWFHPTPPRRRVDFPAWSWTGWEGGVSDIVVYRAEESDYMPVMPPLHIWKAGYNDHPELVYNFNPTPDIIKELERGSDAEEDADTWEDEDVEDEDEDEDLSSDFGSGYDSDEESEGRDVTL